MNMSVIRGRVRVSDLDTALEFFRSTVIPALSRIPGCSDAQAWVNRQTGEVTALTIYDNAEARAAADPAAREILKQSSTWWEGPPPERELYDLAASAAQEGRALVERDVEAFNNGDLEQVARDMAPDVALLTPAGERTGPQAVKENLQNWRNAFPDGRDTVTNIIAAGRTVVVEGDFSGTHSGTLVTSGGDIPASGKRFSQSFVHIYTIDRGLVSKVHSHFDRMGLMTQLGVMPTRTGTST